ncbi:MAG: hypothetical protein K8S54_14940 [Spirochaetia bacterium]|nr:hypothetical protein [Spirochaetia bacterium]
MRTLLPLLLLFCLLPIACKKGRPDTDKPPMSLLLWGQDRGNVESQLKKEGWDVDKTAEYLRATVGPDKENEGLPAPDESPYQLTFYFQNNRLNIVQIQIRNSPERVSEYDKNAIKLFKLTTPLLQKSLPVRTTETGNKIKETHTLFDSGEMFLKVYKSQVEIAESRVEDVPDEMDVMIYSKKENEGITAEGLLNPQEN